MPTKMNAAETKDLIKQEKLIPILRTRSLERLFPIAEAVCKAGCRIFEVTTTIEGIVSEIGRIKDKFPGLCIGLGTVFNKQDAIDAIKNGADFIVSPILNYELVDTVKSLGKMLMLSGFTPTEIYNACNSGADIVKLFPASEVAPTFITELKGPLPFVDIFPTGGLNLISAIQFLAHGAIAVGMGQAIFKPGLLEKGDYPGVTENMKNVLHRIKTMAL